MMFGVHWEEVMSKETSSKESSFESWMNETMERHPGEEGGEKTDHIVILRFRTIKHI